MKLKNLISLATAVLMLGMTAPCEAALNLFLHIDGIPGDSTAVGHTADSDVSDFEFGMSGGGPNPSFSLSLDKNVNIASPTLALNCANGTTNTSATVSCYRTTSGGSLALVYSIVVSNVVVTSVSTSASAGGSPAESLSLRFNWIQWTYVPSTGTGGSGTPIVTTYMSH